MTLMDLLRGTRVESLADLREDHTAYIKSWIKVLREDKRAIFKASALAGKAADYLRSFSRGEAGDA